MIDMRVNCSMDSGTLTFNFEFQDGEPIERTSSMENLSCYVKGPRDWKLTEIHPDHLALSALLIVRPWFNKTLDLPFPVSQKFADTCKSMKIIVSPIDSELIPYDSNNGQYIALAYSGGADSTAALSVLPPTTMPIFLDRPSLGTSLYSKDAALHSIGKLAQLGYDCHVVECNLESIRDPIGFPTDLANGVPAILLAKKLRVFGIAYGTVLESLYGLGRTQFREYAETSHYKNWWNLFEQSGLPISFPTGGISEVGTEIICSKSAIGVLAQSCIRGTTSKPCNFCWKCFRKQTVRSALNLANFDLNQTLQILESKEVRTKLQKLPISHENVLIYAFARLDLKQYPQGFVQRFDHSEKLDYLRHWYPKSSAYIHERIREVTVSKIVSYLGMQSEEMMHLLEGWNNEERISRLNPLIFD